MSRIGSSLILLILLPSSFGPTTAQEVALAIDTLANGTIQVQNAGSGLWNEVTRWRLEEAFRLGTVEGGGPEQFGSVIAIRADSMGRVFVFDALALEIRVFDSLGDYSHSIGGKGEGPGEFRGPLGISVAPEGRLWTEDPANVRYSVFSPSGEYEDGYRRQIPGVIIPSMSAFSPERGFIDWAAVRASTQHRPDSDGSWTTWHPVVFTPRAQYDTMPPLTIWRENASDGRRSPGAEGLLIHVASDGDLWFAKSSEYALYQRTLEGDTTLVVALDAVADKWSGQDRDSLLDHYAARRRPDLRISDIPRQKPIVRKIFTDGVGHVFVIPQVSGIEEGTAMDVFQTSGHYLGRLILPEKISFRIVSPAATRNHLYALVLDEYDVSYVVSWRLVKP
jgi:hypothetical protein